MKSSLNIEGIRQRVSPSVISFSVIKQIVAALCGILFSLAEVFGNYTPFGVAFVAAVPGGCLFASAAGSIIGCIMSHTGVVSLKYISAIIITLIVRRSLCSFKKISCTQYFTPCIAFFPLLATGLSFGLARGITAIGCILCFAESMLCASGAYFFRPASNALIKKRPVYSFSRTELLGLIMGACLLLAPLTQLQVNSLSPVRVMISYFVMITAVYAGAPEGAVAGIIAGFTAGFSSGQTYLIAAYSLGGLLAGIFPSLGKFGAAVSFAAAGGTAALIAGGSSEIIACFIEIAIATVLFAAMPPSLSRRLSGIVDTYKNTPHEDTVRKSVSSRLSFAARALTEVSGSVEAVSDRLTKICARDMGEVYKRAQEQACTKCGLMNYCWETVCDETAAVFAGIGCTLKKCGAVSRSDMPEHFVHRCIRLPQLAGAFNSTYTDYLRREAAENRVNQVRSIVADQFDGIATLLNNLSDEFSEIEHEDRKTALRISRLTSQLGIEPDDILCMVDGCGRTRIELRLGEPCEAPDLRKLTAAVNDACEKRFELPHVVSLNGECVITFRECAAFSLTTAHAQHSCHNAPFCGDAFESFFDEKGRGIMILSDGMGTGGRAAVDGAMAAGLLSKLITAGFDFDSALRVVNSALLVKSPDESLATLDIACIDLFTGNTDFLKAGAPASFICKNGRAKRVEQSSLPAGILREVEFCHSSVELSNDDIIVLVSDGAVEKGSEYILKALEAWHGDDIQALADQLMELAISRTSGEREDDITVVTARLSSVKAA